MKLWGWWRKQERSYRLTAYWPLYAMPHPIPSQFQTFSCVKIATSKHAAVRKLLSYPICWDNTLPGVYLPTSSIVRIMVEEITPDEC